MGLNENRKIEEYLSSVCSQIKHRDVHQQIRLELEGHIKEIASEYVSQGISEDEAVSKAIAQMGDAAHIGQKLNQIHKPRPEWSILTLTLLFVSLGLAALYFIQSTALAVEYPIFEKSLVFTLIGTTVLIGLYFVDYRKVQPYSGYIYLGTLLALFLITVKGGQVNGKSWLSIGTLNIDFVQVSPYLFMLALAGLLDNWNWSETKKIFHGLLLLLVPLLFILMSNSLSAGAIYLAACIVLMLVSGIKSRYALLGIASGIGILLFPVMTAPYRLARFTAFFNPDKDPLASGYLYWQLKKAISTSGLLGQGFTLQPYTIPEVHTDFIFTYITYTFGWLVAFIVAALVILFLVRMARVAAVVKTNYAKLVVSGFVTIFAAQFVWNILMNIGFAPISGVGLPFISYGGSQFMMNMAAVGLISSIYRRKDVIKVVV